jgi:uncharacterized damage-inducible protein DinB
MRGDAVLHYWSQVHRRTEAVMSVVPEERVNWAPGHGAMTFGDVARHLALTERWLFVEVAAGRPSRYSSHDERWGESWAAIRALMFRLHEESRSIVGEFDVHRWDRRVATPAGASVAVWKWLRAMCEHEIHHRGQLYLMLRLCRIGTPPVFGMTSEDVRAAAQLSMNPCDHA